MTTVMYELPFLWQKYGFRHSSIEQLFLDWASLNLKPGHPDRALVDEYYDCVEHCHDQVCWHLERYPEYPFRTPGHMYFDVVDIVAKERADRACAILKIIPAMVEERRAAFLRTHQ